jgi:hypothetical protein
MAAFSVVVIAAGFVSARGVGFEIFEIICSSTANVAFFQIGPSLPGQAGKVSRR